MKDQQNLLPENSNYTLKSLIGRGGMGVVYKAEKVCDFDFKKTFAIKFLSEEASEHKNILNEARIVSMLTHPNIVQIMEIGKDTRGHPFLVMELVEGFSLSKILAANKAPLDISVAISICMEITAALQYIHKDFIPGKSIIHSDVSLQNIMFHKQSFQCKLTDFGFANKIKAGREVEVGETIIGNPYYIAPEHASGDFINCKSDIYSLGIVLYDLLFNNRDFKQPIEEIADKAAEGKTIDRKLIETLEPRLAEVLKRMVAIDPNKRLEDAEAVLYALEAVALDLADFPKVSHKKKELFEAIVQNIKDAPLESDVFSNQGAKTKVIRKKNQKETSAKNPNVKKSAFIKTIGKCIKKGQEYSTKGIVIGLAKSQDFALHIKTQILNASAQMKALDPKTIKIAFPVLVLATLSIVIIGKDSSEPDTVIKKLSGDSSIQSNETVSTKNPESKTPKKPDPSIHVRTVDSPFDDLDKSTENEPSDALTPKAEPLAESQKPQLAKRMNERLQARTKTKEHPLETPKPPVTSELTVKVEPFGKVRIEGIKNNFKYRSNSPNFKKQLREGKYKVIITHPIMGSVTKEIAVDGRNPQINVYHRF